jgi:hypothetical protein
MSHITGALRTLVNWKPRREDKNALRSAVLESYLDMGSSGEDRGTANYIELDVTAHCHALHNAATWLRNNGYPELGLAIDDEAKDGKLRIYFQAKPISHRPRKEVPGNLVELGGIAHLDRQFSGLTDAARAWGQNHQSRAIRGESPNRMTVDNVHND